MDKPIRSCSSHPDDKCALELECEQPADESEPRGGLGLAQDLAWIGGHDGHVVSDGRGLERRCCRLEEGREPRASLYCKEKDAFRVGGRWHRGVDPDVLRC